MESASAEAVQGVYRSYKELSLARQGLIVDGLRAPMTTARDAVTMVVSLLPAQPALADDR